MLQIQIRWNTRHRARLLKERLKLGIHGHVLSIYGIEHLTINSFEDDECCRHVPIGGNHPEISTVFAHEDIENVLRAIGIKPVANQSRALRMVGSDRNSYNLRMPIMLSCAVLIESFLEVRYRELSLNTSRLTLYYAACVAR